MIPALKVLAASAALLAATPAMAEQVYAANATGGEVTFTIDSAPHKLGGGMVNTWRQVPGSYTIKVTTADGRSATGPGVFDPTQAAETRGDRFWCVIVGETKAGELRLLTPDAEWCKGFIDKGN